jgi:signal transduction histidine kinase
MDPAYGLEQARKTRSMGLVMSLLLLAIIPAFMVIDSSFPFLHGIAAWRIGAIVPAVLFLAYAAFGYSRFPRLAVVLHTVQLAALIVTMCGISVVLATRSGFPTFGRTALISSLLVCIFTDFVFAAAARRWLALILLPPLAVMIVFILFSGGDLSPSEKVWLISNPTAIAVGLSILAWYQERSSRKEFLARTELVRTEEALLASEKTRQADRAAILQRLELVLAATRTGLDIVDEDYIVRYVDPARREIMGDPEGRPCYEYFRGLNAPCADCAMQRALKSGTVQVMEQTNPRETDRPTQVTAVPYREDSGKWMVAEVAVDMSERARAEAQRLEWERRTSSSRRLESLGILAGGVAHHFNNLLTVILGHAELLRESGQKDSDTETSLREITKAGTRSRDIVRQLVALGGRQALTMQRVDLGAIVREQAQMLRAAIRQEIAIEYRLADSAGPVSADAGRIGEVLLHLALNAQDAIPDSGTITLETSVVDLVEGSPGDRQGLAAGRYALLSVRDSGVGMDKETAARIFDPFFTTKEQGTSTGLGLSTAHAIVRQHSGAIGVESSPGAGSRFLIYLPITAGR